jgi:hypothetical protein
VGWAFFFIGLVIPVPIGYWLLRKRRADVPLSLVGLATLPVIFWGASLGAKIGPCGVPDCMSHTQHNHLVWSIASLVILGAAFVVLAMHRKMIGGCVMIVGELVGAYSMLKTDVAAAVMILIFAASIGIYVGGNYLVEREEKRGIPDFPPIA